MSSSVSGGRCAVSRPQTCAHVWSGLQPRLRETGRASLNMRNRAVWGSAAALTAAAVLVALFVSLLAHRGGSTTPVSHATPSATATTAAPSPSATAYQPPVVAPSGWTAAGIGTGYLPGIAFAPSSPSTACAYQNQG
jgi:hypothetical protein